MPLELTVLALQRGRFRLQVMEVVLLVSEDCQTVATEYDVVAKQHSQYGDSNGCDASAIAIQPFAETRQTPDPSAINLAVSDDCHVTCYGAPRRGILQRAMLKRT